MLQSIKPEVNTNAVATYLPVISEALSQIEGDYAPPPAPVRPEQKLMADLGLSSLDMMKLTLKLEQALGITVAEDSEFQIETVGQLCTELAQWVADSDASPR